MSSTLSCRHVSVSRYFAEYCDQRVCLSVCLSVCLLSILDLTLTSIVDNDFASRTIKHGGGDIVQFPFTFVLFGNMPQVLAWCVNLNVV